MLPPGGEPGKTGETRLLHLSGTQPHPSRTEEKSGKKQSLPQCHNQVTARRRPVRKLVCFIQRMQTQNLVCANFRHDSNKLALKSHSIFESRD